MAKYEVNMSGLLASANSFENYMRKLERYSNRVDSIRSRLSISGGASIRNTLRTISDGIDIEAGVCRNMSSTAERVYRKYESNENNICGNSKASWTGGIKDKLGDMLEAGAKAPENISKKDNIWDDFKDIIDTLLPAALGVGGILGNIIKGRYGDIIKIASDLCAATSWGAVIFGGASMGGCVSYKEITSKGGGASASFLTAEGEVSFENLRVSAEGSAALIKGKAELDKKYGAISVEGGFLQAEGEVSFGIPDSFSIGSDEAKTAGVDASVSAEVLGAEVEGRLGLEDMNVHGEAEGSLLGAGAEAEAGIVMGDGKVGIKASAGAEAYVAKGEVSGGFTLFGIKFDAKGEGMIGVQAEVGAEIASTEVKLNLGLGPIGIDVAIDWSDFDLTFWD